MRKITKQVCREREVLFKAYFQLKTLIKILILTLLVMPITLLATDNFQRVKQVISAPEQGDIFDPQNYKMFLKEHKRQYLWFENGTLSLAGISLQRLLNDLGLKNLMSINDIKRERLIVEDMALSNGFLLLIKVSDLTTNNSHPLQLLKSSVEQNNMGTVIETLTPQYQQFKQLRLALNHYQRALKMHWPILDSTFVPKLGQSHKLVKAIRKRLEFLGDLPERTQTQSRLDVYDSVVVKSIKSFQLRHGLKADGKLGPQTYRTLNVSPKERVKQIQANLWRWFALPNLPPHKFLLVNIPQYQLSIIEAGQQTLEMKVIVGDSDNPTPQMITEINQITFNPSWTPTRKIIKNELIPEYQQDYLSLKRKNFSFIKGYWKNSEVREIDSPDLNFNKLLQSYRLVQAPGENNALGSFRFNIPNTESIYLHDTPIKSLFNLKHRALSHGCVRLENAKQLASYLLKNNKEMLNQNLLTTESTKKINLNHPLTVYITYQTVWVNKQGILQLAPDIYQLDQKFSPSAI